MTLAHQFPENLTVWRKPMVTGEWRRHVGGNTYFPDWADAEGAADSYRRADPIGVFAVAPWGTPPDRLPHVVTDEGWIGPLWRFLAANAPEMPAEERAEIAGAILAGRPYAGGGGAAAEYTVTPADKGGN